MCCVLCAVDTLSDRPAQLQDEELSDTLALVLAQAVVNKLSDSLAVVKVTKQGYSWSEVKAKAVVERMQHKQKTRCLFDDPFVEQRPSLYA